MAHHFILIYAAVFHIYALPFVTITELMHSFCFIFSAIFDA